MSDIDWGQKRQVYKDAEGDYYVKVETGYMEMTDYREGGRVLSALEMDVKGMLFVGQFTNAEIDNDKYEEQ